MAVMRTVTGDVPLEKMGFCQPHEHLFVASGPGTRMFPALLADDVEKSAQEAALYAAAGGDTLIDAQPYGAGGSLEALRRVSRISGVNIISSCGFHLPHFYPEGHPVFSRDEGALYEGFMRDLETAGAVKIALGEDGVTGEMLPRFRAAGKAAARAKVPVIMHTEKGKGSVEAVELLGKLGVEPRKIMVCHVDRQASDYGIHERAAQTGAVLEYDTIGRFKYHDDESEVNLIKHMLSKGYKIALSLDTTSRRMLSYAGEIGLTYIIKTFIPLLLKSGVSESEVNAMTRDNPAGVFM